MLPGIPLDSPRGLAPVVADIVLVDRRPCLLQIPGVSAAALVNIAPGQGYGGDNILTIPEHPPLPQGQLQIARRPFCDPGYFAALQIPIVRGRTFTEQERLDRADKVIISQLTADSFFPNESLHN